MTMLSRSIRLMCGLFCFQLPGELGSKNKLKGTQSAFELYKICMPTGHSSFYVSPVSSNLIVLTELYKFTTKL